MSRLSGLEDRALFKKEMREAGFVDIRIEPMTHGEAVEDVDRFWSETVRAMAPITCSSAIGREDWTKIQPTALALRVPSRLAHGIVVDGLSGGCAKGVSSRVENRSFRQR